MIVCLCKGISDRRIVEEVTRRGNRTLSQVRRACGACTGCGACVGQVQEIIARAGSVAVARDERR